MKKIRVAVRAEVTAAVAVVTCAVTAAARAESVDAEEDVPVIEAVACSSERVTPQ